MSVEPEREAPHAGVASQAVTVAFGDEAADAYGVLRLGLAEGAASGLAILFHDGDPLVSAEGGVEAADAGSWDRIAAAGLDMEIVEPLRAWRVHFAGDEASLDLDLEALGAIVELPAEHPVAVAGGMTGYDQPVRVTGTASFGGRRVAIDCLGQRGHSWGAPDWETIGVARAVSAWLDDDLAISLTAIRPIGAAHHDGEQVMAAIVRRSAEDVEPAVFEVVDARVSTTYDGGGRQRQAGLELWIDDEWPRRAAGEAICGTSLDLGRLRLDCAFFSWRMNGRQGVGRYDVLRKAPGDGA